MFTSTEQRIRIGRRNLRSMYAYTAVSRLWFDGGIWVIYWQHRGLSLTDIGLLEAILHIVCVLSDVPIGVFADKYGWKLAICLSALLGVVYTLVSLFAHSFWLAAIAFAARGLQVTLNSGSDVAIAYESAGFAQMHDRYLVISGRLFAVSLIALGLAEMAGGALASWSWPAVYIAFTISNIAAFLVALTIREPRDSSVHASAARPTLATIVRTAGQFARQSRPYVSWIVWSSVLSAIVATFSFYGQSMLLEAGWTLLAIGVLTAFENGIGALLSAGAHRLVSWWTLPGTVSLVCLLVVSGLLLFAWLPGIAVGVGYFVISAAMSLADPLVDQGLNTLVPSAGRSTLLSANSTAFSLLMIVGFPVFGAFAAHYGLREVAHVTSLFGLCAAVVVTVWWLKVERHTRLESSQQPVKIDTTGHA